MDKYVKRKGFTPSKAFLILAAVLLLTAVVANSALLMKGVNTFYGLTGTLICLWLGSVLALIATTIGNFFRRAVWSSKGYDGTPVVAFLWMIADGKTTSTKDIFLNFESMLPRQLLEDISGQDGTIAGSEVITEVCETEKVVSSLESIILAVITIVMLVLSQLEVCVASAFALVLVAVLKRTRAKTFHGANTTAKYYQEDMGIYYVIRQAAAMGIPLDNLIEEFGDTEMEYFQDSIFISYSLAGWEGIFMQKALAEDGKPILIPAFTSFCKKERMRNFNYKEAAITNERLNLNDLLFCFLMLHGRPESKKEMIREYYNKLTVGESARGQLIQQELDWHKDMLEGKKVDLNAHPLLKPAAFLKHFSSYQERKKEIEERVLKVAAEAKETIPVEAAEAVTVEAEAVTIEAEAVAEVKE